MQTETLNLNPPLGATTAYVVIPDNEPRAAVILIQEYWGINDHIRDLARRYAKEGYLCVAPDLFRGKIAKDSKEASQLMQALKMEDGLEMIAAAIAETRRTYGIENIGITGYCMGGTFALRAACDFADLKAAAAFYGDIPEQNVLKRLRVPTLFIAASRDNWITPAKVEALKEIARKNNLPIEVVSYDADHAFCNDTRPEVHHPEAAADAWRRVLEHFKKHLLVAAKAST